MLRGLSTSTRRAALAAALIALWLPALAGAQLTVQGRVNDEGGRPVAGAQVTVEGTTTGALAGDDGTYRLVIAAPRSPVTIVARFIGYRPERATLQQTEGTVTQDFTLARDILQLSEVVTTGSRVATERTQLGATLSTIGGEQIAQAASPQIDVALAGKVPGALVTQTSGTPGGGTSVRIRGISTLSRSAEPLYIVDGVIVDNSSTQLVDLGGYTTNRLADLDPNDIERIEIVKGAAAAALYGSRANEGVVQIFTKRGGTGALQTTVRTTYGMDEVERRVAVNQANINAAGNPVTRYDLQDEIFREAQQYSATVQLSGGAERTRYFLSGSLVNQEGVIPSTDYRRQNIRLNLDRELSSWLRLAASTSYIRSNTNLTPNGGVVAQFGVLTGFLFTPNDTNLARNPLTGEFPRAGTAGNPLEIIANWQAPQELTRWIGGLQLTANPLRSVTVDYRLGYDSYTETAQQFIPRNSTASTALAQGLAISSTNRARLMNSDVDVSWQAQLSPRFTFTTSAGMNWQQQRYDIVRARAEDITFLSEVVQGGRQFASESRDDRRTLGFYGQEQVGIADALFLTAALRSDASSAFGSEERTQYFPKFGASFDVGALGAARPFLDAGRIGRLRLRAAVGQSGGQPAGSFDRLANYIFEPSAARAGVVNDARLGNERLKPERQQEMELGADVELLDGRLGIEYTYFERTVKDLILPRAVRPSSGFLDVLENVGELDNFGIELLLRSVNLEGARFGWTTTATLTTNHPIVTQVSTGGAFFIPETFNVIRVEAGRPPGHFFGTTYVRNAEGQILTGTGTPIEDASGNIVGIPAIGPRLVIGDPNPKRYWSVSNDFTLGPRFSFRVQFDAVDDFDVFNFDRRLLETPAFGAGADYARELLGEVPRGYFQARRGVFEEYIEDGSFVKLRELSASYNLPGNWAALARARGGSVTLAGRNLKTWTDYRGWDPETNVGAQRTLVRGFAFATTPIPRNVTLGVTLTY